MLSKLYSIEKFKTIKVILVFYKKNLKLSEIFYKKKKFKFIEVIFYRKIQSYRIFFIAKFKVIEHFLKKNSKISNIF